MLGVSVRSLPHASKGPGLPLLDRGLRDPVSPPRNGNFRLSFRLPPGRFQTALGFPCDHTRLCPNTHDLSSRRGSHFWGGSSDTLTPGHLLRCFQSTLPGAPVPSCTPEPGYRTLRVPQLSGPVAKTSGCLSCYCFGGYSAHTTGEWFLLGYTKTLPSKIGEGRCIVRHHIKP